MSLNAFLFRLGAMAVLFLLASVFGAITISWWAAILSGIGIGLAFTFVSERILRGLLMGKIGNGPIAWYSVHLLGETAWLALLAWGASVLGLAFVPAWPAYLFGFLVWAVLCQEMLRKLPGMIIMYLAIRGGKS